MTWNIRAKFNLKVLAVDDSKLTLTLLSSLLIEQGFGQVAVAESYKVALEKLTGLDRCPFDLVFLDRYIAKESGLDLLQIVRKIDKKVPVIMITQEDEASKVIEALSMGATDYIVKPFSAESLTEKINKILASET